MLPHGLLRPFSRSDGLGARRGVPQDELNAGQPPHPPEIHRHPPAALVLLATLAAGRIRSYVTQGARAGRVNTLAMSRRQT
jgi:hypothetical protein